MSSSSDDTINLAYDGDAATVHPELSAHSRKMAQRVYQVAERVYLAVGYGIANCTMIEGDDGVVIVDVMESIAAGEAALAALRRYCDKPIKAVILTHDHGDHIFGMHAFVSPEEVAAGQVEIYAHETLMDAVLGNVSVVRRAIADRVAYSVGRYLEKGPKGHVNAGIGPDFRWGPVSLIAPTTTFRDSLDIEVAGLRLHLVHAPSETDNELVVWLPDLKVLQSAEVIQGECFPNLHTIRGTPYRDPVNWYKSIDMMRGFGAEHLVPTHGRPVSGKAAVDELLTAYRDAIQYTHDQAVRYINKGYTPDELAERLPGLPAHLAGHPWLGEFYGTVKHSVRQIFGGYLGWFEGDPTFLDPLPRGEAARRQVAMMGGREAVLAAAREALAADDHQWAAQLLTHLTRLDEDDMEARQLKAGALRALGYATRNINWRDWYLTSAMELDDSLPEAARQAGGFSPAVIAALPTARIVETASVRLRAEDCFDARYCLAIEVSDTYESMGLEVRRGVAQFHPRRPDRADGTLTGTKMTIMGLFAQMLSLEEALDGGDASLLGEREELARFLGYFEPPMGARMRLTLR